jgi:hypothetical protein
MSKGKRQALAPALGLALAIFLAACGSGGGGQDQPQRERMSAATANKLAVASEQIADDLDAGDTCTAAAHADDLNDEVESAEIPADIRPEVESTATELVNEVNCPPPPEPEKKPKEDKPKGEDHGDEHGHGGDEGDYGDAVLPGAGGTGPGDFHQPPGQAKKIGLGH